MTSPFISIFFNCHVFLYRIDLFDDIQFSEKFNLSKLNLKALWRWVIRARCEATLKLEKTGREKAKRRDISAMSLFLFMTMLHADVPVGQREMGKEQVRHVLFVGNAMALHSQKDEAVHYMFRRLFVDSKQIIGNVNGASYIEKILDTRPRSSLTGQAILCPSVFEMQLHFRPLIFLEASMRKKVVSIVRNCNSLMRLGFSVRVVMNALNA